MSEVESIAEPDRKVALVALGVLVISLIVLFTGSWSSETAGWALFIAIPASIGALIGAGAMPQRRHGALRFLLAPILFILGFTLLGALVFREGAICIAMVLPLWLPAGVAGSLIIWWRQRRGARMGGGLHSAAWVALPFILLIAERQQPAPWTSHVVTRSVVVDATPEQLWPVLLAIPSIGSSEGKPTFTHDWLGIPRPTETRLVREGDALVRKARWGEDIRFDEQIVAVEPGRRLAWRFAFPDNSVRRHTDRHISPDGPILRVTRGAYRLRPVPGGTLLVLETSYEMRSGFRRYLGWWGERLLGDVQENVLAVVAGRVRGGLKGS